MKVIWYHTKKAERWLRRNCYFGHYQEMGNGIAMEWRCANTILEAMSEAGFTPKDVTVS